MIERVCAVVVTFNRKALLQECLDALRAQTYSVGRILIVDNASTDGTSDALRSGGYLDDAKVEYLKLEQNLGGAGGFHHGFRRAYEAGSEWVWAMDDDTVVEPTALERLFLARARFAEGEQPDLLSSMVQWTDGAPHPMNHAAPKIGDASQAASAQSRGVISIRAASFVATLLHRRVIEQFGLPIADYFIWSDDIEYTARVLRRRLGVAVPESIAVHKTATKYTAVESTPQRFYYHIRNTLWMLTRSDAWSWREALPQFRNLILVIQATLRRAPAKRAVARAVLTGLRDGIFKRPAAQAP